MNKIIELPGLIDLHVHLRDPGQTYKEDFYTGTSAALAGGVTTVVDMPNNLVAVTTETLLDEKISSARGKTVCDIGFNFGTLGDNYDEFDKIKDKVVGLKIYLNITTGNFIIDKPKLAEIYTAWPSDKPIFLHAEEDVSDLVMSTLRKHPKRTHLCHVSSRKELEFIIKAKDEGLPITCGVTPHHLFLSEKDEERMGGFAYMKPYLKPAADQKFLWDNLDAIDVFESDHAPHTQAEKHSSEPPFGVPGVETMLPLFLTAEQEGRLTRQQLLDKLHTTPAKILGLKPEKDTKIEVDMNEYEIKNEELKTKCGWSPFAGRRVIGKVKKVYIRGDLVFKSGKILAQPGSGQIINT
ncbi:MAG TPA: amidohydrolase family protein [Candidatus Saccharimonadales bacterium]|nr:amidohydrolase family protein [Candidatus Saccharimonadales bacterium]